MKKLAIILFLFSLLASCVSSKKLLYKGDYDGAITKSVKKLKKKPTNAKEISVLAKAYKIVNQRDSARINFLRQSGEPNIWDEVFETYTRMSNRQELVRTLNQNVLIKIKFVNVDYNAAILEAKRKAAEYFYAHGSKLLDTGTKENARNAYYDFIKVKNYYKDFKDVESKINQALNLGISRILLRSNNQTGMPLPSIIESELNNFGLSELDQLWYKFDSKKIDNIKYDNYVTINIKTLEVSPEALREERFSESKEIQDGFQYVLDNRGNVMKDSLGNDIKVPKYKTITCYLVQTFQKKSAIIAGSVDIYDASDGRLLKTEPLSAQTFFDNVSLCPIGEIDALTPETKAKLTPPPLPFPTHIDMLSRASLIMKDVTKKVIRDNMYLLR